MKYFYQNLKNSFDFFIRSKFPFTRNGYSLENEDKKDLFTSENQSKREAELFDEFNLTPLKNNSTKKNYIENLYLLDLLQKHLKINTADKLKVLDIGSKNWSYAKSEYFFFKKHCNELDLTGIEIDANRLYSDLYSRAEAAKYNIKNLNGVNYINGDFLTHYQKYDYIVWVLPFVFKFPHIKWGLPIKHFQPFKMLSHAYQSINSGGKIFIINQGKVEFEEQTRLCESLKINYHPIGKVESVFLKQKYDMYLTIILKE